MPQEAEKRLVLEEPLAAMEPVPLAQVQVAERKAAALMLLEQQVLEAPHAVQTEGYKQKLPRLDNRLNCPVP